jgi:cellulose synthase/poly-beta-1,6-N-acetylglucosamine synthase-like glycosyltransferase
MWLILTASLTLLAYAYALYPALVWLWGRVLPRRVRRRDISPPVSFLIPAYNEAQHITGKIRNALQQDYPPDRMEVVVVSDGSTDGTDDLAGKTGAGNVKVVRRAVRSGKPSAINAGLGHCNGEIIVLSDASDFLEPNALRRLVSGFADDEVGCVSGMLVAKEGQGGLDVYRRIENFVRASESAVHSSVGATGALFAVRKNLVPHLPEDTILDDLAIPLHVIRRGYRCVFDSLARCVEGERITHRQEFARKVRTLAGNYQSFAREAWALAPFFSPIWFMALSHKILRLFCPLFLLLALAASAAMALRGSAAGAWLLAGQAAFYAAALFGKLAPPSVRRGKALVPYSFCVLNFAALVAPFAYFTGRAGVRWRKTAVSHAQ